MKRQIVQQIPRKRNLSFERAPKGLKAQKEDSSDSDGENRRLIKSSLDH